MLFSPFDGDGSDAMTGVTESELSAIVTSAERMAGGTAYMDVQATRPHSLGFGLHDSPLGLAGWILEKFHAWCDIRDGMPIRTDRLIDNLMLYWLTGTATSAARLYCEAARAGTAALSVWTGRVDVPTGYAVYPYELMQTPRVWAEKRYNLIHYTIQERGGHFAAFEQPQLFAADVNAFGQTLREQGVCRFSSRPKKYGKHEMGLGLSALQAVQRRVTLWLWLCRSTSSAGRASPGFCSPGRAHSPKH